MTRCVEGRTLFDAAYRALYAKPRDEATLTLYRDHRGACPACLEAHPYSPARLGQEVLDFGARAAGWTPPEGEKNVNAQKCPRCDGQGHTNRPPWVPGDQESWTAAEIRSYPCPPCKGTGILPGGWRPPDEP